MLTVFTTVLPAGGRQAVFVNKSPLPRVRWQDTSTPASQPITCFYLPENPQPDFREVEGGWVLISELDLGDRAGGAGCPLVRG